MWSLSLSDERARWEEEKRVEKALQVSLVESSLPIHTMVVTKIFGHGGSTGLLVTMETITASRLEEVLNESLCLLASKDKEAYVSESMMTHLA